MLLPGLISCLVDVMRQSEVRLLTGREGLAYVLVETPRFVKIKPAGLLAEPGTQKQGLEHQKTVD